MCACAREGRAASLLSGRNFGGWQQNSSCVCVCVCGHGHGRRWRCVFFRWPLGLSGGGGDHPRPLGSGPFAPIFPCDFSLAISLCLLSASSPMRRADGTFLFGEAISVCEASGAGDEGALVGKDGKKRASKKIFSLGRLATDKKGCLCWWFLVGRSIGLGCRVSGALAGAPGFFSTCCFRVGGGTGGEGGGDGWGVEVGQRQATDWPTTTRRRRRKGASWMAQTGAGKEIEEERSKQEAPRVRRRSRAHPCRRRPTTTPDNNSGDDGDEEETVAKGGRWNKPPSA